MSAPRTILVVGAGIAGLSLALALAKFGLRVVLLEREREIGAFGAGLQISPNARRTLNRLGLDDAIARTGFEPAGIDIYAGNSRLPIQTLTLGQAVRDRFGLPYVVMHRGDLAGTLHAATKPFANIEIVTGASGFQMSRKGEKLEATFREADGTARRAYPFAVVGADGVQSTIRTTHLDGPEARYGGRIAWRALVAPDRLSGLIDPTNTTVVMGRSYHVVIYPLPHRGMVNVVLFIDTPESRLQSELVRRAPGLALGRNRRLMRIMEAVGEHWTPWVVSTVAAQRWHAGPIGLIGDAAHAMLPFQAQGAAMAIEDAETLAPLLYSAPNPDHAFARFEAIRRPRIEKVVKLSAANGRIFHMGWPFSSARDIAIRAQGPTGHFTRLDWLYGFDTMKRS